MSPSLVQATRYPNSAVFCHWTSASVAQVQTGSAAPAIDVKVKRNNDKSTEEILRFTKTSLFRVIKAPVYY